MASLIDDLNPSLTTTTLEDGQIQITVTLPAGVLPQFIQLLEALTGLTQYISRKASITRARPSKQFQIQHDNALAQRDRFYARIVTLYDYYTDQGLNRTNAIKQISSELRNEKHPWAAADLVRTALIAAGRPGTPGRAPREVRS
jgi:hypothetical protein